MSYTFSFSTLILLVVRVLSTPPRGCSPLTFKDTPCYTLPAPPLAGSLTLWYNLYITKRLFNAFRISGPTFEVSNCTKFQIFRPLGSLQHSSDPLAGGEGARCPLSKNPTRPSAPSALRASGPKLYPSLWLTPPSCQFLDKSKTMLVGSFDLYNRLPDNLYCVGGDVKPC